MDTQTLNMEDEKEIFFQNPVSAVFGSRQGDSWTSICSDGSASVVENLANLVSNASRDVSGAGMRFPPDPFRKRSKLKLSPPKATLPLDIPWVDTITDVIKDGPRR